MLKNTGHAGTRIQQARQRLGITQETLAETVGVTPTWISQIERGKTPSTGLLTRIATALDVTPSHLLDRAPRISHPGDGGILEVRNAVLSVDDLPGMNRAAAAPPSPQDLAASIQAGWDTYWQGRLGALAAAIPGLITQARAAYREHGSPAAGMAAQAYQLAAKLLVQTGWDDVAYAAARTAWRTSAQAPGRPRDQWQSAAIAGTLSWVLLHQGRHDDAEKVAVTMADQVRPSFAFTALAGEDREDRLRQLTVFGALLLSAAAPASARGDTGAVAGYLAEAHAAAIGFGGDRHDYGVNFGRSQVAMQETYNYATLEQPGMALAATPRVYRADLLGISWGAHHLDIALAYMTQARNLAGRGRGEKYQEALRALQVACGVSPEWFANQGTARQVARELAHRNCRLGTQVRDLTACMRNYLEQLR